MTAIPSTSDASWSVNGGARIRRVTVYETPTRLYIIGSDLSGRLYRVLKMDRLDSKALVIGEVDCVYTRAEIVDMLRSLEEGSSIMAVNGSTSMVGKRPLVERVSNCYGILGVIRFLEGYYLVVVSKALIVATIGYHAIYKVVETQTISIRADSQTVPSADEQRYLRLFQSVDLGTDFFFSYTYDLSRSLQENVRSTNWEDGGSRQLEADSRYVWNSHLMRPLRQNGVSERWLLELLHGFVEQQLLVLPCSRLSFTLIARRSARFAGTRYLKRGANMAGDCANDVETEQVLWDTSSSPHFLHGRFSAFVQRRGSVPLRWCQDPATARVSKPAIQWPFDEPHYPTAAAHFRELRSKYGSPIVVMNLIKRREKRPHEAVLHTKFLDSVHYLNQFVGPSERIVYVSFDVARCNKQSNVLNRLEEVGRRLIPCHGWFQTNPDAALRLSRLWPEAIGDWRPKLSSCGRWAEQRGVVRTNCVDCLDRTNVAQFAISRTALAYQLVAIGVSSDVDLPLFSELCRVLEDVWDDHGDKLALQYAGSQLVHSIKTYKKTAAFQEKSRDVIQSLSRYYSNQFSDYDKQQAINLFLGIYRPGETGPTALWDLQSDYALHFPPTQLQRIGNYCAWWLDPADRKAIKELLDLSEGDGVDDGLVNGLGTIELKNRAIVGDSEADFAAAHRVFEITSFEPLMERSRFVEQKAVALEGVSQPAAQGFRLWRAPTTVESPKTSKAIQPDDEDEETVDDAADTTFMDAQPEWWNLTGGDVTNVANRPGDGGEAEGRRRDATSLLTIGLPDAEAGSHSASLGRLEEYAALSPSSQLQLASPSNRLGACDVRAMRSDGHILSQLPISRGHALFTNDSSFEMALPEVSASSAAIYASSCRLSAGGIPRPSESARALYQTYCAMSLPFQLPLPPSTPILDPVILDRHLQRDD